MIFIVDDETDQLEATERALVRAGHVVKTFTKPQAAIESAAGQEPSLILSDIRMPEMGGFAFREAYARRFPGRTTPFVFLSSLSGTEDLVRGLKSGADDYLTKPIDPRLLEAKVAAVLRTRAKLSNPIFRGDLSLFPFIRVLQFCEANGLTGRVEFESAGRLYNLPFRAGNILLASVEGADDYMAGLYDLAEGIFTIHSQTVDFGTIQEFAAAPVPQVQPIAEKPMGRLSGIRAHQRLFQVQTEFVTYPEPKVLSVVILDGNTLLKRGCEVSPGSSRTAIEELIRERHAAAEAEVRQKIDSLLKDRLEGAPTPKESFNRLVDEGFEAYRRGDLPQALDRWEEAKNYNPADKTLDVNLAILRKKLSQTVRP